MSRKPAQAKSSRAATPSSKPKSKVAAATAKGAKKNSNPAPAPKGPVALRSAAPRKQPAKPATKYYVVAEARDLRISTERPKSDSHVAAADSLDEAKDKAIDYLIELIDLFERRLWELKQKPGGDISADDS